MKHLIKTTAKIFILFISFFVTSICNAQSNNGQLMGKIKDAKTQSILDYATIVVKQDGFVKASTNSDDNGDYVIKNLPAGEYTLEVTYVGYTKYIASGIAVNAGSITLQNCELNIKNEEDIICCLIYILDYKLINETDNIRTLRTKDILKLPMRD